MSKRTALLASAVLITTISLANATDLGKFGNWTVSLDETKKVCMMDARGDHHGVTIIRGKPPAAVPFEKQGERISRIVLDGIINKQLIGKFSQTIRIVNEKGSEIYSNRFTMEKGETRRASADLSPFSVISMGAKLGNNAGIQRIKAPWNSFDVDFTGYQDAEMKLSACYGKL
jgi:hypothetical protein